MNKQWNHLNRTVEQRQELRVRNLRLRFRNRVDAVWLTVLFSIFTIFVLGWFVGVILGNRFGLFDPSLIRPLEDPRILSNVRKGIESQPILDAVYHPKEDRVYISRKGGGIYSFQLSTGLWRTEHPFASGETAAWSQGHENPDIVLLRSGNGTDALSYRPAPGDPHSLWGVTSNGGICRRVENQWQALIHDSQFIGSRGTPVEQSNLTSAAVSTDQRWLVVGTREDGIGIYDLKRREWLTLDLEFYESFQSQAVGHVCYSQDRFWIGGSPGLTQLKFDEDRETWTAVLRPEITGEVRDMDVDRLDRLWVLEKRDCTGDGAGCLRFSRYHIPGDEDSDPGTVEPVAEILMDETNLFPRLTLGDLDFAHYWDGKLIFAGSAGVYSYDTRTHGWKSHYIGSVSASLSFPPGLKQGKGIYYSYGGRIGILTPDILDHTVDQNKDPEKKRTSWRLPGTTGTPLITKFRRGRDDEVLALDRGGNLYRFTPFLKTGKPADNVKLIFKPGTGKMSAGKFNWASAYGDHVLFTGPSGALLHNIVTREYTEIGRDMLPLWFRDSPVNLVTSGQSIYAIAPKRWYTQVHQISTKDASAGRFKNWRQLAVVPGLVKGVQDWGGEGIVLIAGADDGRVIQFSDRRTMLTGLKSHDMDRAVLQDAAAVKGGLAIATPDGVRTYHYYSRTWGAYRRFIDYSPPKELASSRERLFASTVKGQLLEVGRGRPVFKIGHRDSFDMTDNEISDVRVANGKIYLAGSGTINLYDPAKRHVTDSWKFKGKRRVNLVGIVNSQPVAFSDGVVTIGSQPLDQMAGKAVNVFFDDRFTWTVRENETTGTRYLKRYIASAPFSRDTRCYFRNPASGRGVTRFTDAVTTPRKMIAVATNKGLRFYDPEFRTWVSGVNNDPIPAGGNLFIAGNTMAAVDRRVSRGVKQVTFIDLSSLKFPSSCSDISVNILDHPVAVQALAVSTRNSEMAYITPGGSVMQRRDASETELLAPPGTEQPLSSSLKRMFGETSGARDSLLFSSTGTNRVLHYDLNLRAWQEMPLRLGVSNDSLQDIDIVPDAAGNRFIVTAKTLGGLLLMGSLPRPLKSGSGVQLAPVYIPSPGFGHGPGQLVDVQQRGGPDDRWTFVLKNGIKYYNPLNREWSPDIILPGLSGTPSFCRLRNLGVIVSPGNRRWYVAHRKIPHPDTFAGYTPKQGETTVLDDKGTIWRFTGNGTLHRLLLPEEGDYTGTGVPYESPFLISPSRVIRAFDWDRRAVFDTRDGVRVRDGQIDKELDLGEAAKTFRDIKETIPHGNQLWLLNSAGKLAVLTVHPSGNADFKTWPEKVTRFVKRRDGRHWVQFESSGWKYWNLISFTAPPGQDKIRFTAAGGIPPAGLDNSGNMYTWSGQVDRYDARLILPASVTYGDVKALWRGRENDWWAIGPSHIYWIKRSTCPNPDFRSESETPGQTPTIACYKFEDEIVLPSQITASDMPRMIWRKGKKEFDVLYDNGVLVKVDKKFLGGTSASAKTEHETAMPGRLPDTWETLKKKITRLPDGRQAFNPLLKIEVSGDNELLVHRPGGTERLAAYGAEKIDALPPALDAGWLKWNRASSHFEVQTSSGIKTFTPHAFIRGSRFIFEPVDALLVPVPGKLYAANRYGIWQFQKEEIALTDPGLVFRPMEWNRPRGAVHGHFYTSDRVYTHDGNPVAPKQAVFRITVGDVNFAEPILRGRITGKINTGWSGGRTLNAFARNGFAWDQGRKGLAYHQDKLMIQTAAGIHTVSGYTGFEAVPADGQVMSVDGEELYFKSRNTWYRRTAPSKWEKIAADPFENRVLFQDNTWKWELANGTLNISLPNDSHRFRTVPTRHGLAFSSDLILDAGTYENRLFVMSRAFLEIANPSGQLSFMNTTRQAPRPCRGFKSRGQGGESYLILDSGSGFLSWDQTQQAFKPVSQSNLPDRQPLNVQFPSNNPRLRFTRKISGQILKEIKVQDAAGGEKWMPFSLSQKRFPFDVVTSLATLNDRVYVGTLAGLQVYDAPVDFDLKNISAFYRVGSGARLEPVSSVGRPVGNPGEIVAVSASSCIKSNKAAGGLSFVPCSTSDRLDRRLRAESNVWRFVTRNGKLIGQYKDIGGKFNSAPVTVSNGRFSHDRLKDLVIHDGKVMTISFSDWIAVSNELSMDLEKIVETHDARSMAPTRFIRLAEDVAFSLFSAKAGVYIAGRSNRVWYYDKIPGSPGSWMEIKTPEVVRGVLAYGARPPLVLRGRLRLLRPAPGSGGSFNFQYRGLDSKWRTLPWHNNRVALDSWNDFVYLPGQDRIWAGTPAGIVPFSRSRDGKIILDHKNFVVIREPSAAGKILAITEMDIDNTSNTGNTGGSIIVRCESDSALVFKGTPGLGAETGVFKQIKPERNRQIDPFVSRLLVYETKDCPWQWSLEGRGKYQRGRLKGLLNGSEVEIAGGRFLFDGINSMAFFQDKYLEIATDGGGWYRVENGDFRAENIRRPRVPGIEAELVNEVRSGRGRDNQPLLGLSVLGKGFVRLQEKGIAGETEEFPQFLGSDGFWRYERESGKFAVTSDRGTGGRARRDMIDGRFGDDVVTGLPVSALENGKLVYILPTQAGFVKLTPDLARETIYPLVSKNGETKAAGNGKTGQTIRNVLWADTVSTPKRLYYWNNETKSFQLLPGTGNPGIEIKLGEQAVPPGARILSAEDGPQDFTRIRWENKKQRGWTLVSPGKVNGKVNGKENGKENIIGADNVLYFNVQKYGKFHHIRQNSSAPADQPWMRALFNPGHIEFLRYGSDTPFRVDFPEPMDMIAAFGKGERLLVIGKTALYEINLETAMVKCFQ